MNGYCGEHTHYARDSASCKRHPDVDWEWICPCDTSRMEMDIQCGIPVRGLDFDRMDFPKSAAPKLREFAEANRGDSECRAKFAAWRAEHYPGAKEVY